MVVTASISRKTCTLPKIHKLHFVIDMWASNNQPEWKVNPAKPICNKSLLKHTINAFTNCCTELIESPRSTNLICFRARGIIDLERQPWLSQTNNKYLQTQKMAMKSQDAIITLNLNKMLDLQGLRIFTCSQWDRWLKNNQIFIEIHLFETWLIVFFQVMYTHRARYCDQIFFTGD